MGVSQSTWDDVLAAKTPVISVAGVQMRVRLASASDWITALNDGNLEAILPGLLHRKDIELWKNIYFGNRYLVTVDTHRKIALGMVEQASGFPLETALRLVGAASTFWHQFHGWANSKGVNPLRLSLDRFCDLVYFYLVQHADEKQRYRLDTELSRPLPGAPRRTGPPKGWNEEATALAALAAHQKGL